MLLYTLILFAASLLPYVIRMSGLALPRRRGGPGRVFLAYALRIYFAYSDARRRRPSATRSSTLPCCLRRFWSITICSAGRCSRRLRLQARRSSRAPTSPARRTGKSLELTDHAGKPRRLEDFRGKAVVLFFGFTHCPDICPTTLADIASAVKSLGPDAERVQVLMVTVDPERDTPESLAKYVTAFDPRFLGLRGDLAATARSRASSRSTSRSASSGDSYTVDHSAQSYVIDPQGRLRLLVRHDRIGQDLAGDLRAILKGA